MRSENFCDLSGEFFKKRPPWIIEGFDLLIIGIITSALILAITSVWNDAPIVDEIPHIGSGYSYIAKGDHRLNPEHPPLAKDLAGISLKIEGIRDDAAFNHKSWQEDINGQWEFGRELIFRSGNDAVRLARFAKIPQLIFFILIAILIFTWTRKMYGYLAALIALFLFAYSPTVIAHSRFVTTDMPALFGILLGSFAFINYLQNQSKKNLWIAGIAFGIAQLTKYSVFLLVPYFVVLAVLYAFLNSKTKFLSASYLLLATIGIIIIGYVFVVWPVYIPHTWNYPPELQKHHTETILESYGRRSVADTVIFLSDKPLVRGLAEYGLGLLMVTQRSIGGNTTYFMGEVRNWAWPQYFPIVYFIKEPLAFWGLVITSLLFLTYQFGCKIKKIKIQPIIGWLKNHFVELAMLLWLAVYWFTSIRANLNIGVRHLMPVYGFTFILLAGALIKVCSSLNSKKVLATYYLILATLFSWYLFENLQVYPYYLTYFNEIAGGPSGGHRYVVDSNLDWGQDLKRLGKWVDDNKIKKIHLDYFGWSDPGYYMPEKTIHLWGGKYKNAYEFLNENPDGGYMAISASFYMGSREKPETSYAWLENYKPVKIIGNSIFIWYINPR